MNIRNFILILASLFIINSLQNLYGQKKTKNDVPSTNVNRARRSTDYSIDKVHIPLRVKIKKKMTQIAQVHATNKKIKQKKKQEKSLTRQIELTSKKTDKHNRKLAKSQQKMLAKSKKESQKLSNEIQALNDKIAKENAKQQELLLNSKESQQIKKWNDKVLSDQDKAASQKA